jgi:diadenosine tetraphosphatase ApaH/serine/threonine PP2A family protein phosphatase
MPEPLTIALDDATPAPVPLPPLELDGKPFAGGTVILTLSRDREGEPIHSTLVWHARIVDGGWSLKPRIAPRDHAHLAGVSRVWAVVTWAGRRIGELRVKVGRR